MTTPPEQDLHERSWQLTRAISPRPTVRVASVDAAGNALNSYPHTRRISSSVPDSPWAVNLADTDGCFWFLCFDFDAKDSASRAAAARDVTTVTGLLEGHGIDYVCCVSGPTGGHHVWVALKELLPAYQVDDLARAVQQICPTLDITPLVNGATGCVRPPGAPHRSGGNSQLVHGDLDTLVNPSTTGAQIRELTQQVVTIAGRQPDAENAPAVPRLLPRDEQGRVFLPGTRRPLTAAARAALEDPDVRFGDASAILRRVLLGAAASRWRYTDVAHMVDVQPGLEHARTLRDGTRRTPRPLHGHASTPAVLRRQWDKAVQHVASSTTVGHDDTFDDRAMAIATHIRRVQERAHATGGRWATGGGPADRRVLDTLCLFALQAVASSVEADIRRVALTAGVGRETARVALVRLANDGWIHRTTAAEGPRGAVWTIHPQDVIHNISGYARSQADPRPAGAGAATRTHLLTTLETSLSAARHDVFTGAGSLGLAAGTLYARLGTTPAGPGAVAARAGFSLPDTTRTLRRLSELGLACASDTGWSRPARDLRDQAAVRLGVAGRLAGRRDRYLLERELWEWWRAELAWMSTPAATRPKRSRNPGQLALVLDAGTNRYGAHPRRAGGRADFRAARAYLTGICPQARGVGGRSGDQLIIGLLGGREVAA